MNRSKYLEDARIQRNKITALLKKDKTYGEIMNKLGCSYSLIQKVAAAEDLKQPQIYLPIKTIFEVLKDLMENNITLTELAEKHDINLKTIKRYYKTARTVGIDVNERKVGRPRKAS